MTIPGGAGASVIDIAADAIICIDEQQRIILFNRGAEQIFGYRAAEVMGRPLDVLLPERVAAGHAAHVARFGASVSSARLMAERQEIFGRRRDGTEFPAEASISKLESEAGVTYTVILRDVTEQRRSREALRASEERFRLLVENAKDFVMFRYRLGPDAGLEYVSAGCEAVMGWTADEYRADAELALQLVCAGAELTLEILQRSPDLEPEPVELECRRRTGEPVWLRYRYVAVRDSSGEVVAIDGVLHDVTDRRRGEEELRRLALHDTLTGLPNRALLLDRMGMALARLGRGAAFVCVAFIDLDHFKLINDSFGHTVGDQLLVDVARRIGGAVRPRDTVARLGGDEFVVLCESETVEDALRLADRVVEAMRFPFDVNGAEVTVSISGGIGLTQDPSETPMTLLRSADAAVSLAKERGRGRFELFDEAMRIRAARRLDLESSLRQALKRDELRLEYQPVVDLRDSAVVGCEALLRWARTDGVLLPPGEFIGIAEETGLIETIGGWVIHEACGRFAEWSGADQVLRLSVNVSPRQLVLPALPEMVRAALESSGLPPAALCLEITETALIEDTPTAAAALGRLKALGVCVALDDFGTGYSSLSYLNEYPVDVVKLDRSFIDRLRTPQADWTIVDAVVRLAGDLGIAVVAEGVETSPQAEHLRDVGCDMAQGFLFSRPLAADAFAAAISGKACVSPPAAVSVGHH